MMQHTKKVLNIQPNNTDSFQKQQGFQCSSFWIPVKNFWPRYTVGYQLTTTVKQRWTESVLKSMMMETATEAVLVRHENLANWTSLKFTN